MRSTNGIGGRRRDSCEAVIGSGAGARHDSADRDAIADKDPSECALPPIRACWCTYLGNWVATKRTWGPSMDAEEADSIREGLLRVCGRYPRPASPLLGWKTGSARSAPPALRPGTPICDQGSTSSSRDLLAAVMASLEVATL